MWLALVLSSATALVGILFGDDYKVTVGLLAILVCLWNAKLGLK